MVLVLVQGMVGRPPEGDRGLGASCQVPVHLLFACVDACCMGVCMQYLQALIRTRNGGVVKELPNVMFGSNVSC
jgi:hypothetical protein